MVIMASLVPDFILVEEDDKLFLIRDPYSEIYGLSLMKELNPMLEGPGPMSFHKSLESVLSVPTDAEAFYVL